MLNWVHVWTPSWPVHDLNILLVQKGCRVTCCMGRGIVWDVHNYIQTPPSPMATFHSSGSGCTDAGSWLHPPRPAHSSSPLVDWRRRLCSKVSVGHLAGHRDQYSVASSRLQMFRTDIRLPNWLIVGNCRQGAEMKWFVLTIRSC